MAIQQQFKQEVPPGNYLLPYVYEVNHSTKKHKDRIKRKEIVPLDSNDAIQSLVNKVRADLQDFIDFRDEFKDVILPTQSNNKLQ